MVGVLLSLWAASGGMKQLIEAINVAYDESETRKFLRLRGLALLFTLGMIALFVAVLGLLAVVPALLDNTGLGSVGRAVVNVLRAGRCSRAHGGRAGDSLPLRARP